MVNGTRLRNTSVPGRRATVLGLVLLGCITDTAARQIDTLAIRRHTSVLAHDSLMGRATGSPGAASAARYIARQCESLGLAPLAEDYLIPVELIESVVRPGATTLQVRSGRGKTTRTYTAPADFFPNLGRFPARTSITGPAMYVGSADSIARWRTRVPEGTIAVTQGVPRYSTLSGLASRGFAGVIHIAPNRRTYDLMARSRGSSRWAHASADVTSSLLPVIPSVVVRETVADALARGATRDDGRPFALDATVQITIEASIRTMTVHNVGCVLPAADPSRTGGIVAYTAHLDHLGISAPDATGDSIYNGFSDNAVGVAMLLAIARKASTNPPDFPVAVLFFTGEERGLLGSDAFAHDPPGSVERFAAVINLDAGAPPAPPTTWRLAGADTRLRRVGITAGESMGWVVATSGPTPNSDYFPFYRRGVPAVFVVPGPGPYQGMSQAESDALKARWDQYHRAGDHWHADFPLSGLLRYAEYAWAIGKAFGQSRP